MEDWCKMEDWSDITWLVEAAKALDCKVTFEPNGKIHMEGSVYDGTTRAVMAVKDRLAAIMSLKQSELQKVKGEIRMMNMLRRYEP